MSSIYVACLASYNAGILHGEWIDLEGKDTNEVHADIARILRASPCPNVRVDCPECDGQGSIIGPTLTTQCDHCEGRGTVPSAEEWAVHDYDGIPSSFGEYPNLGELLEYVRLVDEHGDAWKAYVSNVGEHYATEDGFTESYQGEYASPEDWAEQFLEDTGAISEVPNNLRSYIDFSAYARDARLNSDVDFVEYEGTLYVFWNH